MHNFQQHTSRLALLGTLASVMALGACSGTSVTPTASTTTAAAPSTTAKSPSTTTGTNAPVISGTPATSVQAGQTYTFSPTASDSSGATLTYSIAGQPVWASFNPVTGELTGAPLPSQVGSYPNVVISVSAGGSSASLAAFTITVAQAAPAIGSATLTWAAPTVNTDGSAITDLAGFHIYYGTSNTALTQLIDVPGATETTYSVPQLPVGTYYFAVTAYNMAGIESAQSSIATKTI